MDTNVKKSGMGISTFDVDYCTDIKDLFKWKFDLEYHLADLAEQLEIKEFLYRNSKKAYSHEWEAICKLRKYRKYQAILYNQINRKITIMKEAKHHSKMTKERNFWKNKARSLMSEDDFKECCLLLE